MKKINEFKSWMDVISPKKEESYDYADMSIGCGTALVTSSSLAISSPVSKWSLNPFKNGNIVINLEERPNIWKRFWMRLLFGWKFEKLK